MPKFSIQEALELRQDIKNTIEGIGLEDFKSFDLLDRLTDFLTQLIDDEGWIEWKGGKFPLANDRVRFQCRYRDGVVGNWINARMSGTSLWEWTDKNTGPADIVAYRLEEDFKKAREYKPTPKIPEGWITIPAIGTEVKSTHPITVINPTETFHVDQIKVEHDYVKASGTKVWVRGEETCWFNLEGGIKPVT